MEFKRGVQALMSYRGEWQKLSQTLRTTSGGSVARDIVRPTQDAQSAIDRLSNSAQRGGSAVARFMDSAFGTSDRIQSVARGLETTAQAIERLNEAYSKGGLAGLGKFLKDTPGEALREQLAASLPDRKKAQDAQINAMEEDLAATEITMGRSGRSQAQIEGVLRSKRAALAAAKRARGDLRMEEAGFRSTPPSMLADPTAPIQGEAGGVGSGGQGKAFQDMYPVDISGRKPLPTRTPLPPQRPAGMVSQSGGDDLKEILRGREDQCDARRAEGRRVSGRSGEAEGRGGKVGAGRAERDLHPERAGR
ncbi:hypothetical protein LOK46_16435 [Methylobacterium sp. NMS14P]|uniref:hypothetical protein n=1 Tax=Methylobacterium sp. NMS14P TaxID=2894310 RepID=UPI00235974D2|nr:hypothetical protein [Methylobacterium sp. NMS14P]WCS22782.1 hypothetical protein LOK46_16435 [Methylobacterium sp. NMS14P]